MYKRQVLFLGSCTNEEDINNNGYSDKEKAKIETLMNLFDSYGWELDTTVSIEPVSYTHLDVYKRQVGFSCCFCNTKISENSDMAKS